jgi:hypothetical protein
MTRTVEEAAEACMDAILTRETAQVGVKARIVAALREARDAALHEAVRVVENVALPQGGNRCEEKTVVAAARALRVLASSPPPAAPARDDRGAEQDPGPCADHAPYIGCVRCAPTATKPCTGPDTGASEEYEEQMFARAASSSGEATALREALDLIRDIETAIYWNDDPAKGMVSGWWSGNPDTAALHARMLRALAAPSQETETRCEHPAAAVTEYRDGHKRCSACAALWYGDENGGWRSEGKEAPAPAPSAATDTGRIDEDRIEAMPGGDLFIHSARCEGGCDYDCGTFVHQRCGGEWNGRGDHRCASPGAGGADAKGAKP